MNSMAKASRYPVELKERAVGMVRELERELGASQDQNRSATRSRAHASPPNLDSPYRQLDLPVQGEFGLTVADRHWVSRFEHGGSTREPGECVGKGGRDVPCPEWARPSEMPEGPVP